MIFAYGFGDHGESAKTESVDDNPIGMNDFFIHIVFSTRLRVSNHKAKRDLRWQPQFPSYREGLQQVIAEYKKK